MFLGQFAHTLDDKFRLALPAKYRSRLADGIVITPGAGVCLHIYPLDEFRALYAKVSALPTLDASAANLRRSIFPFAHDATPDKQNRVVIPQPLREHAGITNEVVVAGAGPFIEVWNPGEWQRAQQGAREQAVQPNGWAALGI
jgi:MraZ protein